MRGNVSKARGAEMAAFEAEIHKEYLANQKFRDNMNTEFNGLEESLHGKIQKDFDSVKDAQETSYQETVADLQKEYDSAIDTLHQQFADGSPKGIFIEVNQLAGKEAGLYLNSADGFVYYWDGTVLSDQVLKYEVYEMGVGKKQTATGAEIFNDYVGNSTNVPYAHVEGKGNNAKLQCLKILSVDGKKITVDTGEYDLDIYGVKMGDYWSIITGISNSGSISKITGRIFGVEPCAIHVDKEISSDFVPSTEHSLIGTLLINGGSVGAIYRDYDTDKDYTVEVSDVPEHFTSHVEGTKSHAFFNAHAEGTKTRAAGISSHAEGCETISWGQNSHAEGEGSKTAGLASHAEGNGSEAFGHASHAEGDSTTADALGSHAEGGKAAASGVYSHAEGELTNALGRSSHAEGSGTYASGRSSHAEGSDTYASGQNAHAEGVGTSACSYGQHVQGRYNIEDADGIYADIVGNGADFDNPSNAYTLDWDGNGRFAGKVYAEKNKELATKDFVTDVVANSGGLVVPDWAMQPSKPTYTAEEVGVYTKEEVDTAINNAIGVVLGGES